MNDLVVLDCTFRDGGYYTSWDFSPQVVSRYLQAMYTSGVDVIEIGFRFLPKDKFLGAFAYSTDAFLSRLDIPDGCIISVMVNAADFINYEGGESQGICKLFASSYFSPVDVVRIATHFKDVSNAKPIAEELKNLGYYVGLNLMQSAGKPSKDIEAKAKEINDWGNVDVLYFADSLGSMDAKMVKDTMQAIRGGWSGEIGVHAHDNKGRALDNTFTALEYGASWLDGTVMGMGRGAGNARTEHLMYDLVSSKGWDKYNPDALFSIAMGDFEKLKRQHNWGMNYAYFIGASNDVHPTYVQSMLGSLRYDINDIHNGLKSLVDSTSNSFSTEKLKEAISGGYSYEGSWSAKDWTDGRDAMVIAPGPRASEHMPAVVEFALKNDIFVVALNTDPTYPKDIIDAYAVCHPTRVMTEMEYYRNAGKPVLLPMSMVHSDLTDIDVLDYGLFIGDNWNATETCCRIPSRLAASYALAALSASLVSKIYLVGFDGFDSDDSRQSEMVNMINAYNVHAYPQLISLTPTSYPVEHSSVYAPIIK